METLSDKSILLQVDITTTERTDYTGQLKGEHLKQETRS